MIRTLKRREAERINIDRVRYMSGRFRRTFSDLKTWEVARIGGSLA
ncbi:MAG: hypothetical protein ACK5Q5_16220 [Planctomycetaceae bacterium]